MPSVSSKEYRLIGTTKTAADLKLQNSTVAASTVQGKDVLVKLHAASLNFRDLAIAAGQYPFGVKDNVVPLSDGSGEVIAIGSEVTEFKVGDRVMGVFNQDHVDGEITPQIMRTGLGGSIDGVLTQYRVFPQHGLVLIPAYLSYEEAATLPCAALTAWNALFGSSKPLLPGQTVLILGTGGVSIFGLQLAVAAGAKTIVTSSSDKKLEIAKQLGATHTINYKTTPEYEKKVLELTNGEGVDHVIEVGGAGTLVKSLASIKMGGVISCIGFVAQPSAQDNNTMPIIGMIVGKVPIVRGVLIGSRRQFQDMNKALEAHKIKPVVDKVFSFEQAQEAYEYLQSQQHVGKVVIKID